MSVPQYAPPPAPRPSRAWKWFLGIGGAMVLVSLLLCIGGGWSVFSGIQDITGQPEHEGEYVVQLESGDGTDVWSEDPTATCTASGPSGPVDDTGIGSQDLSLGDRELHRVMHVEAEETGEHTISCSAPFVVGDGFSVLGLVVSVVAGVACFLGSIVLLVGIILWALRRR